MQQNGMGQDLVEGSIPSKNFDVWQRLYERYSLEPGPLVASRAAVGLTVIPVTQADKLLQTARNTENDVAVASTGTLNVATVPQGERWTLGPMIWNLLTGTWTHSRLYLIDPINVFTLELSRYTATGGAILYEPNSPLTIDEGWTLAINISAFTSGGDLRFQFYRLIEKAF